VAPKPKHGLSEVQLAARAGVHETTWKSHKAITGCPVPRSKRDVPAWVRRYAKWRIANGKVPSQPAQREDPELQKQKLDQSRLRSRLMQIELAKIERGLVTRAEVVTLARDSFALVRQRMNAAVRKLASIFGPMLGPGGDAFAHETLQAEVDSICAAFQRSMDPSDYLDDEGKGGGPAEPRPGDPGGLEAG
jgi:hypothetical protein